MAHNPLSDDDLAATPAACVEKRLLDSLDQLYETYESSVERWVRRLAGPGAEVEDLVHDVFLVALRRKNEFRGDARISTWLFRITELIVRKRRFRRRLHSFLGLVAYGGLRLKKFIDAYGDKGKVFSICNPDFTDAMTQTGSDLVRAMTIVVGCVPFALADTDPNTPGVQPECQVVDKIACDTPGVGACLFTGYQENTLSECMDIEGGTSIAAPLNPANPQINNVPDGERPCWYLWYDTDPVTGCSGAPNGQRISVLRPTGSVAPAGSELVVNCQTCPASNPGCTVTAP
jgi:hypothetical protein